jgi:hypothetical protein
MGSISTSHSEIISSSLSDKKMKAYKKIFNTTFLIVLLTVANSCTDDFKELNTPPNLITDEIITPELLLTGVQYNAILVGMGEADASNYSGMAVSDANLPFADFFADDAWYQTYNTYANNLATIIRLTTEDPEQVNKKAIARIMKVWVFSRATDIYGDIPYFQAVLPPDEAISTPKYDTQESIYQDFFKELKEAAAELDDTKGSYGNADLIYHGDVTKWKKFANSLRLRLALRVRYANEQMAISNMSDLQESDLITSRADDAIMYTSNDVPQHRNGLYNALVNSPGFLIKGLAAKTMLDILNTNNDPRLKVYMDTAKADWVKTLDPPIPYFGYRGHPLLGYVPVTTKYPYGAESVSRMSDFWYVPVIELPVLRTPEVYFALAEAALFNLKAGDANTYFKKGIEAGIIQTQDFFNKSKDQMPGVLKLMEPNASIDELNATLTSLLEYKEMKQSEIDAFLASGATVLSGTNEEKLEQIMNQKIVALYPNALEGWAEWRRTGYPRVLVADNEASTYKGVSPRRFHYPQSESLINSANYNDAVSRMAIAKDDLLNHLWWDANPLAPHEHAGTVESMDAPWIN